MSTTIAESFSRAQTRLTTAIQEGRVSAAVGLVSRLVVIRGVARRDGLDVEGDAWTVPLTSTVIDRAREARRQRLQAAHLARRAS